MYDQFILEYLERVRRKWCERVRLELDQNIDLVEQDLFKQVKSIFNQNLPEDFTLLHEMDCILNEIKACLDGNSNWDINTQLSEIVRLMNDYHTRRNEK